MGQDPLVTAMLADLAQAAALRGRAGEAPYGPARACLRQFQATRLAATHADLLVSPRYRLGAEFFLAELYGPAASLARYAEAERVMPLAIRVLPRAGLETIANAWRLDALTESLDAAMIEAIGPASLAASLATGAPLTPEAYAAAYCGIGRPVDRAAQIDLIGSLASALEQFGRRRFASATVAQMREPARMAGFGDLQGFLERGLAALRAMGPVAPFVAAVTERERLIMERLLAGDATALSWVPPALAES